MNLPFSTWTQYVDHPSFCPWLQQLLAPSPFGATQNPSDCEQHSWLQQFFLPHHWQHCLAVVIKVNTQNRKFPLFANLCWAPSPTLGVVRGLGTCRKTLLACRGLFHLREGLPQPCYRTHRKASSDLIQLNHQNYRIRVIQSSLILDL